MITEILEDTLIELNKSILKIEDTAPTAEIYLEAKKAFLIGVLSQLDNELVLFDKECEAYDSARVTELEDLQKFGASWEAYDGIMASLFKH